MIADCPAQRKAIHPWHIDIQQNNIWLLGQFLQGLFTTFCGNDLILLHFKLIPKHI